MSDYELRNAREWDAASSARYSSSRLSVVSDDGFTKVQGSKAKRQNQVPAAQPTKAPNHVTVNGHNGAHTPQPVLTNGYTNARGVPHRGRGRGGGRGRGSGIADHARERPTNHGAPPPDRSSTQRQKPKSAAELACQQGKPATDSFSFTIPRRVCHRHLQDKAQSLKAQLGAISRITSTHIEESPADVFAVLVWGSEVDVRQAALRLEDLNKSVQPEKWAKNPAFDGRKENRRELKAHEEEQATRLQLFADSQEYPFEYSFIWPDSELSLQYVIDSHDRPRGAFESLRSAHQCSIRCDVANSIIIIQGMHERDVIAAGRTFERIARQMIAEMSQFVKISLLSAPTAPLDQSFVSMDQRVSLNSTLYYLPISQEPKNDTFMVSTPKLWTHRLPPDEAATSRSEKMTRRLDRFNRKTILAGLERSLTNLHFVQKAVRMQVEFGELAFLRYLAPRSGSQHHSLEDFRKTMAKDRTDLLLQAMPPHVQLPTIVDHLLKHPALKNHGDASASVTETYVVTFDFRRPDNKEILRHEQEFSTSYKNDEMEMRRKSWVLMRADSDRRSPLVLSVLDFEKLDWQLKIQAYDILDPKSMAKEYADFEAGVGVGPAPSPAGITGPPTQRASFPRGYHDLVRVTNKPVIQFTLGKTDHILEIAREDMYDTHPFQSTPPKPESKWTASFYYSKWVNDLGEFAYKKHGETPSWQPSLSTFFPEGDDAAAQSTKPRGPRFFLNEIEEVKNILWDAIRPITDGEHGDRATTSERLGTVENEGDGDRTLAK